MTARILVVDDIPANRRLLEAKLSAEYYEVAQAGGGPEALVLAESWSPDVILLDVMMPGMDGFEVCRRLKALPATAHIPVVMVTALTEPEARVRGLEAGADDFLSKPVDDATLFARLRTLLRMKQVLDAWRQRVETARALGLEPPAAPDVSPSAARVLLVEEDAEEAAALAATLAAGGLTVEQARGAADAWPRLVAAGPSGPEGGTGYDLVVLGLRSAGPDGLRLVSRIRAHAGTREVPVLLVAGPEQRELVLRGFDLGANDHVLRPVDPHELGARARNQIRRHRYQQRLRADLDRSIEMAVTDPLTGLRNRLYLYGYLRTALRTQPAAVLLADVDHFKAVNDTHGHAAGDVALRAVAERLRAHIRAADVVARWGGEEFVVAMAGATAEDAMAAAERLRAAVAASPLAADAGGAPIGTTISIGVALAPRGGAVDPLIRAADAALYRAKRAGRNRVEFATPEDWDAAAAAADSRTGLGVT
ncbi:PleD family two-component system response regulator [Caldovatus aquaticus]|uniref:diguanylate cyclase n=1 Tax=Caldovatus aquaticus TaxID=2865671 RepID=A0ABS7EXP3_9PROT|nr:PleD family two-component system response regulator [Caldovatus aquaticus]MBW8268119.1 PleD family two-component system response regulator [Caldovatus aquaticus]